MRALVTGGARRLGALIVRDLAQRGWDLCVHFHTASAEANALKDELSRTRQVEVFQADLGEAGGAEALRDQLAGRPVDLVVHSASEWAVDTWESASSETWRSQHLLHGWTTVVLARMLARQGSGHLVTLLDARSRDHDPTHFSYGYAKREMLALTRGLALELAPQVRVNGLALGLVLEPEGMTVTEWQKLGERSAPLRSTVDPENVLEALQFLLKTSSVTGQIVSLDGGRHLKGDLFGSI